MTSIDSSKTQAVWNARYGSEAFAFGTEPNDFLVAAYAQHLGAEKESGAPSSSPSSSSAAVAAANPAPPGRLSVLCLGDGEGRNGVWLAQQGHHVTAVDLSDVGMAKAAALAKQRGTSITTHVADLATFELGEQQWDLIVSIFCHVPSAIRRPLHARVLRALKPGGWFIYEGYNPEQLPRTTGGPKDVDLLPTIDLLQEDFRLAATEEASGAGGAGGASGAGYGVEHAFVGLRDVVEGAFHSGEASVNQLVVHKSA